MNKDYENLNDYRDYLEKYINKIQQLDKQKLKNWDYDPDDDFFPDKQKYMPEFGNVELDKYCLNNRHYSKYIKKKQGNLYSDHRDSVHKKIKPTNVKKDQQSQPVTAVQYRFEVGDLVRGNSNHPDWPEAQLELLGGIIISTEDPREDGGDWSVPFYQVLWPGGVFETVGQDWIEMYV